MSVVIYGDDCIFFASFMTDAVGCLRTSASLYLDATYIDVRHKANSLHLKGVL